MSRNEALTGLFGAYASDEEDNSGSGKEGGAGELLQGGREEARTSETRSDDEHPVLSSLLSPGHFLEAASVAQLAPSASEQALAGASDGGNAAASADAAQQRSGGVASTSVAPLPPELVEPPPGEVDPALEARLEHLHRVKAETGKRLTAELRRMRAYRNPDFLEKMVQFHGIAGAGTNFAPEVFNPAGFPKEDYYEELAKKWEEETKRRLEERNKAGGPQFTRGAPEVAKKPPIGLSSGASQAAIFAAQAKAQALISSAGAKRSKWDTAPRR